MDNPELGPGVVHDRLMFDPARCRADAQRRLELAYQVPTPGEASEWRGWWAAHAASDDPAVALAATRGFVLSAAELAAVPITRQRVRTLVARGRWTLAGIGYVCPLDIRDDNPQLCVRRQHVLTAVAAARRAGNHAVTGPAQ